MHSDTLKNQIWEGGGGGGAATKSTNVLTLLLLVGWQGYMFLESCLSQGYPIIFYIRTLHRTVKLCCEATQIRSIRRV